MALNNNIESIQNNLKPAIEFGKMPPQAIELEETVLGAILLEKDAVLSVIDILSLL